MMIQVQPLLLHMSFSPFRFYLTLLSYCGQAVFVTIIFEPKKGIENLKFHDFVRYAEKNGDFTS